MKRLIVILVLSLVGAGAGAGAGVFMQPDPASEPNADGAEEVMAQGSEGAAVSATQAIDDADALREDEVARALEAADSAGDDRATDNAPQRDFVRLDKQFIVPIVGEDRVASLVVLSIALEVDEGQSDSVFAVEPKLRDVFLGVLFNHAQSRGFDGGFTRKDRLADLRRSLTVAAQNVLGEIAHGVLLTNIVRQDI